MASVTFQPPAIEDIKGHLEYGEDLGEAAARQFARKLFDIFDHLAEYPELGRSREDLRKQLRAFAIKRLRLTVFYAFDKKKDTASIARVLRHERDIDAAFADDE